MTKDSSLGAEHLCSSGCLNGVVALLSLVLVSCAALSPVGPDSGSEHLDRSLLLAAPANFEVALKDNQAALVAGKTAPDVALYNAGFIWAHPSNPKKDSTKAIHSFQALINEHPRSALLEPAKTWILVLEQQQRITDEKRKLAEEKRTLDKEREHLAQERQKLNYANEKSRKLDLEIEKRRRQTFSK